MKILHLTFHRSPQYDLVSKAQTTDWPEVRGKIAAFAQDHHDRTIAVWKAVLTAE